MGKKFSAMKFSENEALVTEVTVHRKHTDERNESMTDYESKTSEFRRDHFRTSEFLAGLFCTYSYSNCLLAS